MPNAEVTTNEIMEFLQINMVTREEFNDFKSVTKTEFTVLTEEVKVLSTRVGSLEVRFEDVDTRVGHIENQMVTKDYLDDKFADFGAKIDKKINKQTKRHETLVDILASKSILQEADVEKLKN